MLHQHDAQRHADWLDDAAPNAGGRAVDLFAPKGCNVPRTRGDEPAIDAQNIKLKECSPHSWG